MVPTIFLNGEQTANHRSRPNREWEFVDTFLFYFFKLLEKYTYQNEYTITYLTIFLSKFYRYEIYHIHVFFIH